VRKLPGRINILEEPGRSPGQLVGGSGTDGGRQPEGLGYGRGSSVGGSLEAQEKVSVQKGYGRRGRPTKNPRTNIFQLRLTNDEVDLLDLISYSTEDSKSDVIRKALKMYASVKKSSY
jgi:hypothetical protein